jgi:ribonuclease Y
VANVSGGILETITSIPFLVLITVLICIPAGYFLCFFITTKKRHIQEKEAKRLLEEATQKAQRLEKEADLALKDELFKKRETFEKEIQEARAELKQFEKRLDRREDNLERKLEILTKKERYVEGLQNQLQAKLNEIREKEDQLKETLEEETSKLLKIAGYSREEAEKLLMARLEKELEVSCAKKIADTLNRAKETAQEEVAIIISNAIQRCASHQTAESIVSTVELPNEEMKGRIIGREGRNIRAFEKATGIDVIVDDTPGVIVLSGFDSVRREVARRTMEKLIADGRIHPARIEEIAVETFKEVEDHIKETGKQVCYDMGFHDMPPEMVELLGRLQYRASYGQNQLQHSIEVAELCGLMAGELRLDVKLAKRCGLLHDIGKALGSDVEGNHAALGADIAKKHEERREVINAIASHHEDVPVESPYGALTAAGDTISAGRPGARRESLEKYIKRLETLEKIATRFPGVKGAYAIQAGRELRVIVSPEQIDDATAQKICYEIARGIEGQLEFPGEIVVTVIRETRSVEHAK